MRRNKVRLKDNLNHRNLLMKPKYNKSLKQKNKGNKNKQADKTETSNSHCPHGRLRAESTSWSTRFRKYHSTSLDVVCLKSTNWSWQPSWLSESLREMASSTQYKSSTWSSTRPTRTHPPCPNRSRPSCRKPYGLISRVLKAFPSSTGSVQAYNNNT